MNLTSPTLCDILTAMRSSLEGSPRPKRARRRDGVSTRGVVLEAAGRVFAERGFSDATSKEICALAGVNGAAVNYYFGGKENLYEEVLAEGHKQFMTLEDLTAIMDSAVSPEEKLRALMRRLVRTAAFASELWGVRVFLRELASPSMYADKVMLSVIFPKAVKLRELVCELTGFPPDSPRAQRAAGFVMLPCLSLILFPERLRAKVLPATAAAGEGLVEDLARYALGGLNALKDAERSEGPGEGGTPPALDAAL